MINFPLLPILHEIRHHRGQLTTKAMSHNFHAGSFMHTKTGGRREIKVMSHSKRCNNKDSAANE